MTFLATHPILLIIGAFPITAHGIFFGLAAVVAIVVFERLALQAKLPVDNLYERALLIFVAGLIAARIGFFVVYPSTFQSISQVLAIWEGGLISYIGMVVGLLAAFWLFSREKRRLVWLDLLGLVSLLGWAIGRLGNYYAGDSVGVLAAGSPFYGRVPIQLMEAVWCFGAFVVLYAWNKKQRLKPGNLIFWSFLVYFGGRFVIDSWRDEGIWLGLHLSQWTSLVLLILTAGSFWWLRRQKGGYASQ